MFIISGWRWATFQRIQRRSVVQRHSLHNGRWCRGSRSSVHQSPQHSSCARAFYCCMYHRLLVSACQWVHAPLQKKKNANASFRIFFIKIKNKFRFDFTAKELLRIVVFFFPFARMLALLLEHFVHAYIISTFSFLLYIGDWTLFANYINKNNCALLEPLYVVCRECDISFWFQGTSVFKVVARDPDTGINDVIRYTIEGELMFTFAFRQLVSKRMFLWVVEWVGCECTC